MPETTDQRLARLRPLLPNTVPERVLRTRIEAGWDDHRIVTTDLVPQSYTGRAASPSFRRGRR